jgi:uncharacterized BrkB/YihY/UPF0761 family membrane protein
MARRRGVAFTLGALLFMVFALAAIAVLPVVTGYLSLSNATEWLVTLGKWAILLIGVALAVSLIYRYGPSREKPQWRWVTWGSAVVAAHFGGLQQEVWLPGRGDRLHPPSDGRGLTGDAHVAQ